MKIISATECEQWLRATLSSDSVSLGEVFSHQIAYALPTDSGVKKSLAHAICHSVRAGTGGMFWITGWGIFPSCENMDLFEGYRASLGEARPLHVAPGHVFVPSELQQIESLLSLALYFCWDAILVDDRGEFAFEVSHDEYISLHSKQPETLVRLQNELAGFKLKQFVAWRNESA